MRTEAAAAPVVADEFRNIVERVASIGLDADGATTRLAYSAEERAAQMAIAGLFAADRFEPRTDAAGNLIITLPGSDPALAPVVTGSHLDSVPQGGRWDGALGVYAGAAALLEIARSGVAHRRSISLVAFASEESPRFAQSAYRFGSRAMAGIADIDDVWRLRDAQGTSLAEAMQALALDPAAIGEARVAADEWHCLLELHIDQGLTLVNAGVPVAGVSAITGSCRFRVTVSGQADHSGAARMSSRRDALAGAAEMVLAAERIGRADDEQLVVTVGTIEVQPSSISVVPGLAEFGVDIRSVDRGVMVDARDALQRAVDEIAARRRLQVRVTPIRDVEPVVMSDAVNAIVGEAISAAGIEPRLVPSHAGHDTGSFAGHPRLGMLFVRNVSGRSHSAHEDIEWDDAVIGKGILRDSLVRLANQE